MSRFKAQRIVFGIMALVVMLTIAGDILSGRARTSDAIPRRIVAGSLAGLLLMLLAIPMPRAAVGFASLAGISVLFVNPDGINVIKRITEAGGAEPVGFQGFSGGGGFDQGGGSGGSFDEPQPTTPTIQFPAVTTLDELLEQQQSN